jgi:hypothetical protein
MVDPQSSRIFQMQYTALRAAFVTTLDSLLRYSLDPNGAATRPCGFLDCFPMLNGTAPQIQMECLFNTWSQLQQNPGEPLRLLDELILYAAYESLAQLAEGKPGQPLKVVMNGPVPLSGDHDQWLYSKTRCLQLAASQAAEPHFLRELSEIEDPGPGVNPEFSANWSESREEMLSLLGRWVARKDVLSGTVGLLTNDEKDILRAFFEEHSGLVR